LTRTIQDLSPTGSTAIGDAMRLAVRELLKAGVENKAIIVMTDGENTMGAQPDLVMQAIRRNHNNQQALTDDVKVFLVAFDVNAQVFEKVKTAGASVVESRDSASLEGILTTVVEEVLLEKSR
jgi:Mg-chelatase subunit ChlD